jgi:zinc and cadmium transporter
MPPAAMPVIETIAATLVVASASVAVAAFLSFRLLGRFVHRMVSFSIGVLLATAFLHLIPEAFESQAPLRALCGAMLAGLFGFFFLEKIAVYRHSHHFEGDGHHHAHGHDAHEAGRGGVFILIGSAVHNLSDGIVIAGAFLASPWVGVAATLSILAHEIPHKIGDFIVLSNARVTKGRAIGYASISSSAIVVGGIVGLLFLERLTGLIPFVLVIAASNFIYISLSDLVPQMHRVDPHGSRGRDALWQAALIAVGVLVVVVLNGWVGS